MTAEVFCFNGFLTLRGRFSPVCHHLRAACCTKDPCEGLTLEVVHDRHAQLKAPRAPGMQGLY